MGFSFFFCYTQRSILVLRGPIFWPYFLSCWWSPFSDKPLLHLCLVGYCVLFLYWVSGFTLRSLIHLEVIFVQDDKHGSNFSFLHVWASKFSITICWKCCLPPVCIPPVCIFGIFVKYEIAINYVQSLWVFYFIPLTYMSVFEPMPCDFSYYSSVIELEVWYKNLSSIPCPSCFGCLGSFVTLM